MPTDGENRDMAIRVIADKLRLDMPGEPPASYLNGWAEYIYENWVEGKILVRDGLSDTGLDELLEDLIPS